MGFSDAFVCLSEFRIILYNTLKLIDGVGELSVIGDEITLASQGVIHTKFMIKLEPGQLEGRKTDLKVGVFRGDEMIDNVKTTFIGPVL